VIAHIKVSFTKLLDLTDATIRRAIGVSKADLVSDDFSLTQAIGHLAQLLGFEALRVPSVTDLGTNIVIFTENLGAGSAIAVQEIADVEV
jgi:RES domain-containing protein